MSTGTVIADALWAVILLVCGTWFVQGIKGYKEKPQLPVKVKRWLLARTIFAWFLVVIFAMMNLGAVGQQNTAPTESSDSSAYGLGMLIGISIRLVGLALSLWWVRKIGRERRQRRLNIAQQKIATTT
jgi:protein-S-isoprenylcysteine O-methyltransferase Ste14